jgi:PAS domain S-box-containing protein
MKIEDIAKQIGEAFISDNSGIQSEELFSYLKVFFVQVSKILDLSQDEIWVTDLNTRLIFSIGAVFKTFGFTPEERVGMDIKQIFTPESQARIRPVMFEKMEMVEKGLRPEPTHLFLEAWHKSGDKVHIELFGDFLYGPDQRPVGLIGVNHDLTQVRHSEARYRKLINSTGDMMLVVQNWRVQFANQNVVESTGFQPDEMIGKMFTDFIHPDDVELVTNIHRNRLEDLPVQDFYMLRILNKAGEVRTNEVKISVTEFENKPGHLVVLRDKTKQIKEQAVEKAQAVLFEISFRYHIEDFLRYALKELEKISESSISCFHIFDTKCEYFVHSVWRDGSKVIKQSNYPISATHFSLRNNLCKKRKTIVRYGQKITQNERLFLWNNAAVNSEIIVPLSRSKRMEAVAVVGNKTSAYTTEDIEAVKKLSQIIFELVLRKKADEDLAISEQRFRQISQFAKTVVWEFDVNGRFTFVSEAASEVWGYQPQEVVDGIHFFDLVPPENRDDFKQLGLNLIKQQKPFSGLVSQLLKKDGKVIWVQRNGAPMHDHKGNIFSYRGVDIDITAEIETNKILRKNEEKYRHLVENINEALLTLSPGGKIKYINPIIQKFTGFPALSYFDHHITDFIDPEDVKYFEVGDGFLDPKKPLPPEFRLITRNDRECIVRSSVMPVYENNILSAYSCLLQDITTSHKAIKAIQESEERFRMIALSSNDLMYEVDLETKRLKWFGNTKAVFDELPVPEFVEDYLKYVHPDDLAYLNNTVNEGILSKQQWTVSYRLAIPGKQDIYLKGKGSALYRDGRPVKGFGALTDVTEETHAQSELKATKRKAEAANKLKSAFLSNMSHELRTPLHHVLGFSQILMDNDDIETAREFAKEINHSGNNLLGIIDEILTLTRLDKKHVELNREKHNLSDLFAALRSMFTQYFHTYAANADKIQLVFKPDVDLESYSIVTDKSKLMHIMINIFKNAVKFTHEGIIQYGCTYAGNNIISFYVKDTGIGISPEARATIFERFNQVENDADRNYEGLGIGLTIAQMLTELLDGKLHFNSEPGKGSVFYLDLPLNGSPD